MRRTLLCALALTLRAAAVSAQDSVSYVVRFPNAVHHEASITATFTHLPAAPLQLRMSRSSPGRYALHEFAKNVYSVTAEDGRGRALTLTRPDPYGWDAAGHDGTVRVTYTLFGDRADGTYAGIDLNHAHLNMPATFMWARGLMQRPIRVTFEPPAGSGWKVATQLRPTNAATTFTAPDLQYFMDSPTELSDFRLRDWQVMSGGKTYTIRIALHDPGTDQELDRYTDMAKKVVAEEEAVFGEFPAYDVGTYTFIACYGPWAAGDGMEHRNSTSLTSGGTLANNMMGNLSTLSHEYFHSWNMERIRARAIEPFDFERADMSGELWFGEGFTQYYTQLFLRRAGLIDDDQYIATLNGTINTVVNAPGRRFFSAVGMSRQAPFIDAAVSIDPTNQLNTFISYYTYGAAIALGLDFTLRTRFHKSVDDLMLAMWLRHGRPEKPYTLDDIRAALAQVSGDAAFAGDYFNRYMAGQEIVDYASLLAGAGVLVRKANPGHATLGPAFLQVQNGRVTFGAGTAVGTPWYDAGLERGDPLASLDGTDITSVEQLNELIAQHQPGQRVAVTWLNRGIPRTGSITFVEDPQLEVLSYERAGMPVTDAMRRMRSEWLDSKAAR